ncbi:MAG: DUF4422 domain-containing protein [Tannerellaceae bacterium]|nr:DUF4422 domain-containing protein [Tannerellaceae bacterium]
MPQVKILVCSHKEDFVRSDDMHMPVQGGKAIAKVDLGIQGDNTGENISEKNPYYSEMTVLYWAWKNLKDVDYIGLCHYRRYFKFSSLPFRSIMIASVDQFQRMKNTTFNLSKHLGKYDIILAKPFIYPYSLDVNFSIEHYSDDYRLLKKVVLGLFPDYYPSFIHVMEENNKFYGCNMFIAKWDILDNYCKWVFAVLVEVEKLNDYSKYSTYQARVLGAMGERLLQVYVHKHKLKFKTYPIVMLDEQLSLPSVSKSITHFITVNIAFLITRPWRWWKAKYFGGSRS